MEINKEACDFCGNDYKCSNGNYEGKYISKFELKLCRICFSGSHDGVPPLYEDKFVSLCKERGKDLPQRNRHDLYAIR